jgi:hypothetical protein
VGASTAAALAGCTGLIGGGSGGAAGTARSATQAILNGNAGELEGNVHSESPLQPIDESDVGTGAAQSDSVSVNVQAAEVVNEDPSEETVRNQFGSGPDAETIVQIVTNAESVAIVDVEAEVTVSANGQSASNINTVRYLMATEDGDWKVVTSGSAGVA